MDFVYGDKKMRTQKTNVKNHEMNLGSMARVAMLAACAFGVGFFLFACGGKTGGGGNNNTIQPCVNEEECDPGWICVGNICQPADGGQVRKRGGQKTRGRWCAGSRPQGVALG